MENTKTDKTEMDKTEKKETKIYYYNCNAQRYERDSLRVLLRNNFECQIIILCETNLDKSLKNEELFDNDFKVYRKDRSDLNSNNKDGGGVLIAVKEFENSEVTVKFSHIEQVLVEVKLDDKKVLFGVSYVSPKAHESIYDDHISSVRELLSKYSEVNIFGNFNFNETFWSFTPDDNNEVEALEKTKNHILQKFTECGLKQMNYFGNKIGKVNDLIYTNDPTNKFLIQLDISQFPNPTLLIHWGKVANTLKERYNKNREKPSIDIDCINPDGKPEFYSICGCKICRYKMFLSSDKHEKMCDCVKNCSKEVCDCRKKNLPCSMSYCLCEACDNPLGKTDVPKKRKATTAVSIVHDCSCIKECTKRCGCRINGEKCDKYCNCPSSCPNRFFHE